MRRTDHGQDFVPIERAEPKRAGEMAALILSLIADPPVAFILPINNLLE